MNDAGLQVRTVAGAQFWERIAKICGPLIWENPSVNTHTSNPIIYTLKSVWMPPVLPRASFWLDVGVLRQTLIITLAQRRICRVAFNKPPCQIRPGDPEHIHYINFTSIKPLQRIQMLLEAQKWRRNVWQMCFLAQNNWSRIEIKSQSNIHHRYSLLLGDMF